MFENSYYNSNVAQTIMLDSREIIRIPIERIRPNPYQPRKNFTKTTLLELSESIKEYGVIQPISVRRLNGGYYELVAGERRLRASEMAGLSDIPAIVTEISDNDSAILALIENLQREDLNYLEEAEGYYCLIAEHGMTQDELARKVGKSQSTVANKIRLLKHSPLVKKILLDNELSERHARALLKLPDEQVQLRVLKIICDKEYNVQKTEDLINRTIGRYVKPNQTRAFNKSDCAYNREQSGKVKIVVKDIKVFVNTIRESIFMLKNAGVEAKAAQFDRGDYIEFIVRIPKSENSLPLE